MILLFVLLFLYWFYDGFSMFFMVGLKFIGEVDWLELDLLLVDYLV